MGTYFFLGKMKILRLIRNIAMNFTVVILIAVVEVS